MNKTIIIVFLIAATFIAGCSQNRTSPAAIQVFAQKDIDSTQASIILNKTSGLPDNTQFSIALVTDTSTIYVGVICANDSIFSIENHDAYFEIGSISKIFTSTLLASFVRANKIELTDSISAFLPFTLKDSIEISFGQLANHTSGLPNVPTGTIIKSLLNMENPYKNFDENVLESYLKNDLSLSRDPGGKYSDSNLGMGVLGHSLSLVGEKPFTELIQNQVFNAYNLQHTTYSREEVKTLLVTGLNANGKRATNWDMAALEGAGGIFSTAEDMAKFAKAHCNKSDSTLALTREVSFVVDDNTAIGLGWTILKHETGNNLYSQMGATGGYSSAILLDPSQCKAVVILSNVSGSNEYSGKIEQLCSELMETMRNKDVIDLQE